MATGEVLSGGVLLPNGIVADTVLNAESDDSTGQNQLIMGQSAPHHLTNGITEDKEVGEHELPGITQSGASPTEESAPEDAEEAGAQTQLHIVTGDSPADSTPGSSAPPLSASESFYHDSESVVQHDFEPAPDPTASSSAQIAPAGLTSTSQSQPLGPGSAADPPRPAAVASSGGQGTDSLQKGLLGAAPLQPAPPPVVAAQPAVAQPVIREFYLVKIPKPDLTAENNRMRIVEMKLKEKREKQNFISAALRLKQAARSDAYAALRAARERARACSAEVRKKFEEARPLQEMLKRLNEGGNAARARSRGLEASTEAELNEIIAGKEYRMQHESISLAEEKQLLKEIKQLEASRSKVRETEALTATVAESLGQKDAIQAQLKPLLAEADVLKQERDAAQKICETYEAEAKALEEAVQELLDERSAAMADSDAVYRELRDLKTECYRKEEEFRQYRRDIAVALELAAAKNVAGLERLCSDQAERINAKLTTDVVFRRAYVKANQLSTIRRFGTFDTRRLGLDEDPATLLEGSEGGTAKGAAGPRAGAPATGPGTGPVAKAASQGREAKGTITTAAKATAGVEQKGEGEEGAPGPKSRAKNFEAAAAGAKSGVKGAAKEAESGKGGPPPPPSAAAGVLTVVAEASPAAAAAVGFGEADGAPPGDMDADKERRRQEAMAKAKEAEERKRKLAERAQQRAESRAAREAEEAAKRREKERERRARKKAALVEKRATMGGEGEDVEGEAAQVEGEEMHGAEEEKRKHRKEDATSEGLTKRQRKRMAALRPKQQGEDAGSSGTTVKKRGQRGSSSMMWIAGAAVFVLLGVLAAAVLLRNQLFAAPQPVFEGA